MGCRGAGSLTESARCRAMKSCGPLRWRACAMTVCLPGKRASARVCVLPACARVLDAPETVVEWHRLERRGYTWDVACAPTI